MVSAGFYMKRCLELAQRAKGHTAPNPIVGALLVYNDRVIGEGWHQHYGGAHAEVNCLESVVIEDKHLIPESTMYVSLEPCAHFGKTPPCANRLVQEKIKKVVISNADPFAQVQGRGIEILNANNIAVEQDVLKHEGLWVNRRFFCFHGEQRPYIILKWAQSADGYFAPLDGTRQQLSNTHSQQLLHKWRTEEGAILIGKNTALADNPLLTSRHWTGNQPLRIVIDKNLQVPVSNNVYNADAPTWIINEKEESLDGNIHRIKLIFDDYLVRQILQKLHEINILSLIVEGGAATLNTFISQGLWDEARIFKTGVSLGNGIPAPLLQNSTPAFTSALDTDMLEVYTNNSPYPYAPDMEL